LLLARFQVSAAKHNRTALFSVLVQRAVAIPCRRFRTACQSHLQRSRIKNPRHSEYDSVLNAKLRRRFPISRPTDATCDRFYFLSTCVLYMFQASSAHHQESFNRPISCVDVYLRHCLVRKLHLLVYLLKIYKDPETLKIR
jgi:hypothetical protein